MQAVEEASVIAGRHLARLRALSEKTTLQQENLQHRLELELWAFKRRTSSTAPEQKDLITLRGIDERAQAKLDAYNRVKQSMFPEEDVTVG